MKGNWTMRLILLILTVMISVKQVFADPYTDYILKGSIRANGNIHSSNFDKIGEYKNCCPKYESAFGIGPAIFIGGEIRNVFNLFGYDINYSTTLGYNDLSGAYAITQHIGNDLGNDDYQKIIVEHKLDMTYSLLSNEHSLWFNPSKDIPLGIKLGVNLGIPIQKQFNQREILLEPSNATFPDGTTDFNPASAELPNAAGLLVSLSLGARYKVAAFSDFDLFADAGFNYGINDIASDMDWVIHQVSLGVSVHYNFPKSDPPRPKAPPIPAAPEPEAPPIARKPEMRIDTEFDYKKVKTGDTLNVTINKHEFVTYASVLPILIFEKNSTKIIPVKYMVANIETYYDETFRASEKLNVSETYPELIYHHLKNNPGSSVKIIAESEDEDESTLKSRINLVSESLTGKGIDPKLISTDIRTIKPNRDKNPEITEESRKVFFDFSKSGGLIDVKVSTDYLVDNFNKVMNIYPVFFAEDTAKFYGKTIYNDSKETNLKQGANQVVLASSLFVPTGSKLNTFEITAGVADSEGNIAEDMSVFYLAYEEKLIKSYINLNRNDRESEIEEFIIGFTRFDKSEFYLINEFVVDYVRSKAAEGKTLEIIPLTDNIGTPEYNENLANERAKKAIELIGKQYSRYEVKLPAGDVFTNSTPYGRMMNRAVIIRIK